MGSFKKIITVSLLLFLLYHLYSDSDPAVKIATGEWPPYISSELPGYGPVIRIIERAFALEDLKIEIAFFPWKRTELVVLNNEYNALAVQGWTEERENDYYFSDTIIEGDLVFFHRNNIDFEWKTIEDLRSYNIGGTISYDYGGELMTAYRENWINLEWAKTDLLNLRKVLHNRIDLFPCNLLSAQRLLEQNFSERERSSLTYNGNPIRTTSYFLTFSKTEENLILLQKLNSGLTRLKESGDYEQIMEVGKWLSVSEKDN